MQSSLSRYFVPDFVHSVRFRPWFSPFHSISSLISSARLHRLVPDFVRQASPPQSHQSTLIVAPSDGKNFEEKVDGLPVNDIKLPVKHVLSRELQLHQLIPSVVTYLVAKILGVRLAEKKLGTKRLRSKLGSVNMQKVMEHEAYWGGFTRRSDGPGSRLYGQPRHEARFWEAVDFEAKQYLIETARGNTPSSRFFSAERRFDMVAAHNRVFKCMNFF